MAMMDLTSWIFKGGQQAYYKQQDEFELYVRTALEVRSVEHRHLRDPDMLPVPCVPAERDALGGICYCPSRPSLLS